MRSEEHRVEKECRSRWSPQNSTYEVGLCLEFRRVLFRSLLGTDPLRRIARAQLVAPPPRRGEVHLDQVALPEMVDGAGDVPAPQLRGGAAGVLIRITRIDDDDIARVQYSPHVLERRPGRGEPPA